MFMSALPQKRCLVIVSDFDILYPCIPCSMDPRSTCSSLLFYDSMNSEFYSPPRIPLTRAELVPPLTFSWDIPCWCQCLKRRDLNLGWQVTQWANIWWWFWPLYLQQSGGFGLGQVLVQIIVLIRNILGLLNHGELVHNNSSFFATIFIPPERFRDVLKVNGAFF